MRHYLGLIKIALQMEAIFLKYDSSTDYNRLNDVHSTLRVRTFSKLL